MREQGAAAPVFILYVKCIRAAYEQLHSLCHPPSCLFTKWSFARFLLLYFRFTSIILVGVHARLWNFALATEFWVILFHVMIGLFAVPKVMSQIVCCTEPSWKELRKTVG